MVMLRPAFTRRARAAVPADPEEADKPLPPELPTSTLYFLEPVARLARRRDDVPEIARIGRNVYACGRTAVVSRYASPGELARAIATGPSRIVYLIDDNMVAGALDPGLPPDYRKRMKEFLASGHERILDVATDIVVPSRLLGELYRTMAPGLAVHLCHPIWPDRTAPCIASETGRLRIAYLGSRSHQRDMRIVAGRLARLLRRRPDIELFTTLDPGNVFKRAEVRCFRIPTLRWPEHRQFVCAFSADIGLNPLVDTPFNRCRSVNKFVEYDLLGAVCLHSRSVISPDERLEMPTEFAVGDRPNEWIDRIAAYLDDRDRLEADKALYRGRIEGWALEGSAVALWEELLFEAPRPVDRHPRLPSPGFLSS